jgi:hypothetical protein
LKRYHDVISKKSIEWSSLIYSFTSEGKEYFSYTQPVSFNNVPGRDPGIESPGPDDPSHNKPTYVGHKIVGHIHYHPPKSDPTGGINEKFSKPDKIINEASKKNMYLVTFTGKLIRYEGLKQENRFGLEGDPTTREIGKKVGSEFEKNENFKGSLNPKKITAKDFYWGSSLKK